MNDMTPDEARGLLSHVDRRGLLVAGELRRALETLAGMHSTYRLEVRHAPGSDTWHARQETDDLDEIRYFLEVNRQLGEIPDEDKRVVVRRYADWEVIDG